MFAYIKFNAECHRHKNKDIVEVAQIKHFNPTKWKNKYYKVKCGEGTCTGLIIFVEDTIDKLKKLIATKRATLPPKNIREAAETTDSESNKEGTAKKARTKDKVEEIRKTLQQKINQVERMTNLQPMQNNNKENQQCISKDKYEENRNVKRKTECYVLSHDNLEKKNRILKSQIQEADAKIAEQSNKIMELNTLNMELQRKIVAYFDEFKVSAHNFEEIRSREGTEAPPVGFIRKQDNTIHLGRNIWLSKLSYDAAVCNARTKQMVVKNLAIAVFGLEVLQMSSVTGIKCNKYKDRKPKPKLNETKILAIQDIFRYWMIEIKKNSEVEAQVECSKVPLYIARKISDMNRPAKSDNKIKRMISDTELEPSENSSNTGQKKSAQLKEISDSEPESENSCNTGKKEKSAQLHEISDSEPESENSCNTGKKEKSAQLHEISDSEPESENSCNTGKREKSAQLHEISDTELKPSKNSDNTSDKEKSAQLDGDTFIQTME